MMNDKLIMREDWIKCELEEVCDIYAGVGFPKNKQGKIKGDFPFYKVGDISKNVKVGNRYLELCDNYINKGDIAKIENKLLPPKSIAFAKIGEALKLNRRCITTDYSLVDNNAIGIKANASLTDLFLYFFFLTIQLEKYSRATTVPSVRKSDIASIKFLLPPLVEQKAIVKKIEELFSSLDSGIADLKKAQDQLKIYRQAVLKKAFEGELTKAWREQQTDLPTADELLKQIKEERQKHYEQQLENWKQAIKAWEKNGKEGKKPTKPQKIKQFKGISEYDYYKLPKLPSSWDWEKFGNVCLKIMDGTHFSPKNIENGDFKYITAKNIKEGRIDLKKLSYVTKEDHLAIYERCDVKKGDILYIKDGATTGRAAINNFDEEFSLLSSVGVFRTSHNLILPKFLEHYLNAQITRNRMLSNIAGVAITRLTLVKLNNSVFIICSPEEQHRIVKEIESRLSVCDKVEESITESLEKAQALRQSILKKAFEGTLLSEEEIAKCKAAPDYEPASVLLERIKKNKKQ